MKIKVEIELSNDMFRHLSDEDLAKTIAARVHRALGNACHTMDQYDKILVSAVEIVERPEVTS